jgi:hypothetical protein
MKTYPHPNSRFCCSPLPQHLPYKDYIHPRFRGWRLSLRREVPIRILRDLVDAPEVDLATRSAIRFEMLRRGQN